MPGLSNIFHLQAQTEILRSSFNGFADGFEVDHKLWKIKKYHQKII